MKIFVLSTLIYFSANALRADNIYVGESGSGSIGKYSSSGTAISANLITGLTNPRDIKIDADGNLLVTCAGSSVPSSIGLYTTSGVALNRKLVTMSAPYFFFSAVLVGTNLATIVQNTATDPSFSLAGTNVAATNASFLSTYTRYSGSIVSDGSFYYVNDTLLNHLQKFNLDGTLVTYNLATTPNPNSTMTIDGTNLYVVSLSSNSVSKYATSGQLINSSLISGLQEPTSIAADGHGHVFVANYSAGTVGEYTTDGAVVNSNLITNLNGPYGIAVERTAPILTITQTNNLILVAWSSSGDFVLQTNGDLSTADWLEDTNVTVGSVNNTATFLSPANSLYFRLESTNGY